MPRDDEVLVEVRPAGVDPSVWHLMTGRPLMARVALGLRKPKNPVRGWDGAGRVEAVGAKVTEFKPGPRHRCLGRRRFLRRPTGRGVRRLGE
ncbi:alcohol dehydrogenase catalytic domain-containing protein [Streptomyces sp. NPDC005808]|uniref:alcohol dehydrogenase catalytic domain-containing protein n=1 Tax=Streptomyces sp. NPDC005808 TaxID=3364734 RepID=UPI0036A4829B